MIIPECISSVLTKLGFISPSQIPTKIQGNTMILELPSNFLLEEYLKENGNEELEKVLNRTIIREVTIYYKHNPDKYIEIISRHVPMGSVDIDIIKQILEY